MKTEDIETRPKDDPKRITVYDVKGYSIFVGRNAHANEELVSGHKEAHPDCLWLHAFGQKGPTVVLCVANHSLVVLDPMVLRAAASKALKFTVATTRKVIYAKLEDVYKPEGANSGVWRTWRTEVLEV